MKTRSIPSVCVLLALSTFNLQPSATLAQGTAFTYQGRLNDGANPAAGIYDLRFTIYDSTNNPGTIVAGPITNSATRITNGLFAALLDFGDVFPGAGRWLEIAVRTNGAGIYTTLAPLQPLTPAPYAIFAEGASNVFGVIPSAGLSGSYSSAVTFNNSNDSFNGSFSGNGGGITNVNAATLGGVSANGFWKTTGNAGTTAGVNFVGTADNQPLELRVNGQRALRLELIGPDAPNVIGGYSNNFVGATLSGATIAGGGLIGAVNRIAGAGFNGAIGGGRNNSVSNFNGTVSGGANNAAIGNAATVSGGSENTAGGDHDAVAGGQANSSIGYHSSIAGGLQNTNDGPVSTIGGGERNFIANAADHATIGGGFANTIFGSAGPVLDTIGGGSGNTIQQDVAYATIGGGVGNAVQTSSHSATIGGGTDNLVQTGSTNSVIAGGINNLIQSSAYAAIGGGYQNTNSGNYATVAGGYENLASGIGSFIGGGGQDGFIPAGNQASGAASVIGGGVANRATGDGAFIGGGGYDGGSVLGNQASAGGAVIGGGVANTASFRYSTVGGGRNNTASGDTFGQTTVAGGINNMATGDGSTVGGGGGNIAGGGLQGQATVSGGYQNNASGAYATIGGGRQNIASGSWSMVPGGFSNIVSGQYSLAAGNSAQALHNGDFVWADSQGAAYSSDLNNQFKIRAGGGIVLDVSGSSGLSPAAVYVNSTSANGVGMYIVETSSDASFVVNNAGTGSIIKGFNGGGNPVFEVLHSGAVNALSFNPSSDRNLKENVATISAADVLDKIAVLPITQWNYKEDPDRKHIGPMAQDFHAAFGLNGTDDKHISVVDEGGVALAAIQGLKRKVEDGSQRTENRIQKLETENAGLKRRLEALEKIITAEKH